MVAWMLFNNNREEEKMVQLGLCCIFRDEPIRFRTITAKTLLSLSRENQLVKLSEICLYNSVQLKKALTFCNHNGIGAFRILSPFFPRYTHPEVAYQLCDLPEDELIKTNLASVRKMSKDFNIRLSFHPDQFIIISSPRHDVVDNAIRELEYQGFLAETVGADVINIHGGGMYGNKPEALSRFVKNFSRLSERVRSRLTLENDDNAYTVKDLLPVCRKLTIPLAYDVHHHRCNPDGLSVEKATDLVLMTWQSVGKKPYFHISSPKNGWSGGAPKPHADYIDPADFPSCWKKMTVTVDVEAKAKELAVLRLKSDLGLK
jgi:UV DNA damage endonuclease